MCSYFKLLKRCLIHVWRPKDRVFFYLCWKRNGANYSSPCHLRSPYYIFHRFIQYFMIKAFSFILIFCPVIFFLYYSIISVTTPAPTVLPPSLIANLKPCSIAIGCISSTVALMLSPGITISTPSGNTTIPVTSVVLK